MSKKDYAFLYRRSEWKTKSKAFLEANPICIMCGARSTVTDHILPHKGNPFLFWEQTNWQSLCDRCHNSTKQKQEHRSAIAPSGYPTDKNHHWNK